MLFSEYLNQEWVPALGCTEPASIALAASAAASQDIGNIVKIRLSVDSRIYKNCYAVGIPYSGHMIGIKWATAIGAFLPDPSLKLECFRAINSSVLMRAKNLIAENKIEVSVDPSKTDLYIDCHIQGSKAESRALITFDHTNLTIFEKDGSASKQKKAETQIGTKGKFRRLVASMSFEEMLELALSIDKTDRERLREGIALNLRIAEHGLTLFPKRFIDLMKGELLSTISTHVCAGVYARMWGEDFTVMSLAGSGNKGIVAAVPLAIYGEKQAIPSERIDEALALTCLVTSATTHHLGTLSAVCGCSNAAGIGLAAGLVFLDDGGSHEMSLAINNMVGNVTGMICDGAKIGCALKTMTAVDAAFRAASLAMSGIGIPPSDGIVGSTGVLSLKNLGRIATIGMDSTDKEILSIMQEKLKSFGTT